MRHVVEVALGIGVIEVDGRRRHLITQRKNAENTFDYAGGTQQVAGHRLGRAHRETCGMSPKSLFDRDGFRAISEHGRGRVGVQILDCRRIEPRIAQGIAHREGCAGAILGGRGDVVRVSAHAEANELGIDARTVQAVDAGRAGAGGSAVVTLYCDRGDADGTVR